MIELLQCIEIVSTSGFIFHSNLQEIQPIRSSGTVDRWTFWEAAVFSRPTFISGHRIRFPMSIFKRAINTSISLIHMSRNFDSDRKSYRKCPTPSWAVRLTMSRGDHLARRWHTGKKKGFRKLPGPWNRSPGEVKRLRSFLRFTEMNVPPRVLRDWVVFDGISGLIEKNHGRVRQLPCFSRNHANRKENKTFIWGKCSLTSIDESRTILSSEESAP